MTDDGHDPFLVPPEVLASLRRPRLSYAVASLPEPEAVELAHIDLLVGNLESYVGKFEAALALFEYAERRLVDHEASVEHRWAFIAARDAAMTIYHFGIILAAIHDQIGFCPTVLPHFDNASMRLAKRLFDAHFYRAKRIRHAISHEAGMMKSRAKLKLTREGRKRSHQIPLNLSIGNIWGRRFETTHEGERMSFELSRGTLQKMKRINDLVLDAFRPVALAFAPRPTAR